MPNTERLTGALDAGRDATQRTLEAGRDATQRTQDRVESLFRELLQTNLEQVEQAQKILEEFIDRSRKASERLVELIDSEVRGQVEALSLATRADVRRLEERIADLERSSGVAPTARRATSAAAAPAKGTKKKAAATSTAGRASAGGTSKKAAGATKKTGTATKQASTRAAAKAPAKKANEAAGSDA